MSTPLAIRLAQLARMLSSPVDGEVLAAARAMGRTLTARGHDFHFLAGLIEGGDPGVARKAPPREPPAYGDDVDWRSVIAFLIALDGAGLSPRESDFVETLRRWRGRPTDKQLAWAAAIYDRVQRQRRRSA
jgi:hypothetical protein